MASKWMKNARVSDYRIERVIKCYAYMLTARQARSTNDPALRTTLSENTIYRIYGLIRRKLAEIHYYLPLEVVLAPDEDDHWGITEEREISMSYLMGVIRRERMGFSSHTKSLHEMEIYKRLEVAQTTQIHDIDVNAVSRQIFRDIKAAIKHTGLLNGKTLETQRWDDYCTTEDIRSDLPRIKRHITNAKHEYQKEISRKLYRSLCDIAGIEPGNI